MTKVLIELKNNMVTNVETTSEDVEVFVFDHDVISEGSIAEVKRYLAHAEEPVEVDIVAPEDEFVADLEDLIARGQAMLEEMTGESDDEEADEVDEADEAS